MTKFIEDFVPVVKEVGLNTNKNATFGGNVTITGTLSSGAEAVTSQIITSASANAFAVGLTGSTNPIFNVDNSTASAVAGLTIKGAATGGMVAITATDSGSNTSLSIAAKGTGSIKFLGAASPTGSAGNIALTNAAGSANAVNIFNYNSDATPGGEIDLYRGATLAGQIQANSGNSLVLNGVTGFQLQYNGVSQMQSGATYIAQLVPFKVFNTANAHALQVTPNGQDTNSSFEVDTSTASAATGLLVKSAAAAAGLAVTTTSSGADENLTIAAKGAGTIAFNPAVVATAGGAANDGIKFGSLGVGLFTGTGAPSFSAMNGSIYVDSNATTTTTRIYVNKSGAGTAGATWTNLTTAA